MSTGDSGIMEVNKTDEMRNKRKNAKIIKSLQSAQVGGHGQIAAADYTSAGADEMRQ
jgi:hypothetical protein